MTHVGEQVRRGPMRRVLLVVALVISALFAYLAVEDAELGRTWAALADTRLEWLGPVLGVLTGAFFLRALRWRSVFTGIRRPPLVEVVRARVVALNRWGGVPIAEATGTAFVERVFDVLSLLVLLFVFLSWFPSISWTESAVVLTIVLAPVVVSGYRLPRNGDLRVRAAESRLGPIRHATGHVE